MKHEMTERTSPINVQISCTCGFSRQITRRQNAWARAAKVRAAYSEHDREIIKREAQDRR